MDARSYYRRLFDQRELSDVQAMVTWCRGVPAGEVVARLGADSASGVRVSLREAHTGEVVFELAVASEPHTAEKELRAGAVPWNRPSSRRS